MTRPKLYVGHDRARPEVVDALIKHPVLNTKLFDPNTTIMNYNLSNVAEDTCKLDLVFIDMILLSQSKLFLGNDASTFSLIIVYVRQYLDKQRKASPVGNVASLLYQHMGPHNQTNIRDNLFGSKFELSQLKTPKM